MDNMLDIEQASLHLNKSTKTIRRYVRTNKLDYHMVGGRYMFSVADLDKLLDKETSPLDNAALLDRIESIENALQSISERLERLEHQTPIPAPVVVPARPAALRPTRLLQIDERRPGDTLPADHVAVSTFSKQHNVAESTVRRAVEKGDLIAHRGKWKLGNAIVKLALDRSGQRKFWEIYHYPNSLGGKGYPGGRDCPDCPHNV